MVEENLPWYIKKPFPRGNAYRKSDLALLDMDYNGEPIEVNIYDLIEHSYGLTTLHLAEVLGVSWGVVARAKNQGTAEKRKAEFARILKIPEWYFDKVTTCDFDIIENCKNEFFAEWSKEDVDRIKKVAEQKLDEKYHRQNVESRPFRKKENDELIEKIVSSSGYFHDLSDDYRMRWYVIEIRLQEKEYMGSVYYQYGSNSAGITPSILANLIDFVESLSCEEIDILNDECLLINDIDLYVDKNGKDIHFKLHNANGETINKSIPANKLPLYIVGYDIVFSEGRGKKKERRHCKSCLNFAPISGTAKGHCRVRDELVQQSRTICAFQYEEKTGEH